MYPKKYKLLNSDSIVLNQTSEVLTYDIGQLKSNFSASSIVKSYVLNYNDSTSADYYSIASKFYLNQSSTASNLIIPSSYFNMNVGSSSASNIILFSFADHNYKDGISNLNVRNNISINCNALYYNHNTGLSGSYGVNSLSSSITYQLYDVPTSLTSGNMMIKILSNSGYTSNITTVPNLIIGKIFYNYALIVLDSVSNFQPILNNAVNGQTVDFYIPFPSMPGSAYPKSTFNSTTAGNINIISTNFSGILFNGNANSYFSTTSSIENSIVINDINVNFQINKNSYNISTNILKDDFEYSSNPTALLDLNSAPTIGTEESPNYFSGVAFYDAENNLIAIGKTSMPLKKTNKRDYTLNFKLDM